MAVNATTWFDSITGSDTQITSGGSTIIDVRTSQGAAVFCRFSVAVVGAGTATVEVTYESDPTIATNWWTVDLTNGAVEIDSEITGIKISSAGGTMDAIVRGA